MVLVQVANGIFIPYAQVVTVVRQVRCVADWWLNAATSFVESMSDACASCALIVPLACDKSIPLVTPTVSGFKLCKSAKVICTGGSCWWKIGYISGVNRCIAFGGSLEVGRLATCRNGDCIVKWLVLSDF